jgi:hypothetical protein
MVYPSELELDGSSITIGDKRRESVLRLTNCLSNYTSGEGALIRRGAVPRASCSGDGIYGQPMRETLGVRVIYSAH